MVPPFRTGVTLGWRMGRLFGETDEELIDELYDWCVRQQKSGS